MWCPGPDVRSLTFRSRLAKHMYAIPAVLIAGFLLSFSCLFAHSTGPKPRYTGGFKENSCNFCHNAYPLNDGRAKGGIFQIDGVPRLYEPGKTYTLSILLGQPGQSRWGFELSARFADSGRQAGQWVLSGEQTQQKLESEVQYVTQTGKGSEGDAPDGPVEYRVRWTAPSQAEGLILFNAAGNAADDSDTPLGDYIYTAGSFSKPAGAAGPAARPAAMAAAPAHGKAEQRVQETPRGISLPSPVDLKRGSVEILIQHRFFESLRDASLAGALGIDSGANIGLGVNFGLTDRLSAGISRSRNDQIVELRGGYEILTSPGSAWKLSLQGGVEGQRNFHEQYSPFLQLAAAMDRGPFRLSLVPTMVFNSRPDQLVQYNRESAIHPDSNHSFSLGIGADVAVHRKVSLLGEYVPRLFGYGGLQQRNDQLGAGVAIRTWGHVFTVLVSSSRDFTPAQYAVNALQRDVALGFNIYRRIR